MVRLRALGEKACGGDRRACSGDRQFWPVISLSHFNMKHTVFLGDVVVVVAQLGGQRNDGDVSSNFKDQARSAAGFHGRIRISPSSSATPSFSCQPRQCRHRRSMSVEAGVDIRSSLADLVLEPSIEGIGWSLRVTCQMFHVCNPGRLKCATAFPLRGRLNIRDFIKAVQHCGWLI